MQTSKIVTGDTYAIKRNGELTRFRVTAIITRKTSQGTSSEVTGECLDGGAPFQTLTVNPADIMGPFDQFKELTDKAAAEKAERERVAEEKLTRAKKVRRALYRLAGMSVPPDKDYNQPFRVNYSSSIEISQEGVQALSDALELKRSQLVADTSA